MAKIKLSNANKAIAHFNVMMLQSILDGKDNNFEQLYDAKVHASVDKKYNDSMIIVAKKIRFKQSERDEHFYVIYQYDLEGNFIREIDYRDVGEVFFNNLKFIM